MVHLNHHLYVCGLFVGFCFGFLRSYLRYMQGEVQQYLKLGFSHRCINCENWVNPPILWNLRLKCCKWKALFCFSSLLAPKDHAASHLDSEDKRNLYPLRLFMLYNGKSWLAEKIPHTFCEVYCVNERTSECVCSGCIECHGCHLLTPSGTTQLFSCVRTER